MLIVDEPAVSVDRVAALRAEIVGVDKLAPCLDGSWRPYVNLDNAASTPPFRYVQAKVDELLEWYSSVHRGSGFKSQICTYAYDQAREIVARFLGADTSAQAVIFVKNTSEAINLLAHTLEWQADDVVITSEMEHHSNDLPWRSVAQTIHVGVDGEGALDLAALQHALAEHAGRVRLVALTGASNMTGFMPPVHEIAGWAHAAGAQILVDCAQLAPHRVVAMGPVGGANSLDFVAISGHKLYAPYGTGALVGPKEVFRRRPPLYRGGGTIEIVSLEEVHWAEPPERNEVGSPNVIGAVALAAAIQVLNRVGMDALAAHEMELTAHALRLLAAIPGVHIYGSRDPDHVADRLGVIAFGVDGIAHGSVAAILSFEGAIGVRNGCFCAHPYVLRLLGVGRAEYERHRDEVLAGDRSHLPGLVRASFGCYNTLAEVDRLAEMVARVACGDYFGDYVVDRASGSYLPRGFDTGTLATTFQI